MFDNFVFRNIPRNIEGVSHLSYIPNREYPHIPAVSRIPHCKFPHIPVVWRFHFVFMMSKQLISCVDCWFRMRERFLAERSRKNAFGGAFSPSKAPFFCSTRVCGRFSIVKGAVFEFDRVRARSARAAQQLAPEDPRELSHQY